MSIRHIITAFFALFGIGFYRIKNQERLKRYEARQRWESKWDILANYPIDTVLDIGANEGQFAALIHRILPNATIISFEPIPDCYKRLELTLQAIPGSKGYNVALGNKREQQQLFKSGFSPSSSLLEMSDTHKKNFPYTAENTPETIEVVTLDEIADDMNLGHTVLIKIDVQGYEKMVLEGGVNTIARAKYLLVEISCYELYVGEALFDVVYRMITDAGFIYRGNIDQLCSPENGTILSVDAFFERLAKA